MMKPNYVRVVIDRAIQRELDYSVPETLADRIGIGSRVRVPFRDNSALATVLATLDQSHAKGIPPIEAIIAAVLLRKTSLDNQTLRALAKRGLIDLREEAVERDPHADEEFIATTNLELNAEQVLALKKVTDAVAAPETAKPILLHGVTGSGKTEIYLQAIRGALERGRSAIVLVPEISLTPQTVERFQSRFAEMHDAVAVLHSHLSQGERHDEWHKIHSGRARIVIGARSAVFAPLQNVGLIVVDEEHETTYKQEEAPRYHARDVAVVRAKMEKCVVVLGSATPSLESYHNAAIGKYRLVTLTQRIDEKQMPLMRIVDLRQQRRKEK